MEVELFSVGYPPRTGGLTILVLRDSTSREDFPNSRVLGEYLKYIIRGVAIVAATASVIHARRYCPKNFPKSIAITSSANSPFVETSKNTGLGEGGPEKYLWT